MTSKDCIQGHTPLSDDELVSPAIGASDGGQLPSHESLLNLRLACPPSDLFFFPSSPISVFPDSPALEAAPAASAVSSGGAASEAQSPTTTHDTASDRQVEISAPPPETAAPDALQSEADGQQNRLRFLPKDDAAEAHRLLDSAWRLGSNTAMTTASMTADAPNMWRTFMKGTPITNGVARGRNYAKRVNPLTRTIWGPGSLLGTYNALGMLANGKLPDGGKFLLENVTNSLTFISAHKKISGHYAKQPGILQPWHQAVAALSKRGIGYTANRMPTLAPGVGVGFAGLSLWGRMNRPDSWANNLGIAGDLTAATGLIAQFFAQYKEGFLKKTFLAPALPWMVRGAMAAWLAQVPVRFGDAYQTSVLLEAAANAVPDSQKRYHGPQNWFATIANSYPPGHFKRVLLNAIPETGNMLLTRYVQYWLSKLKLKDGDGES